MISNRIFTFGLLMTGLLLLPPRLKVAGQDREQSGAIIAAEMGIPITEESLIANLKDRNEGRAAIVASAFLALEKTPRAVEALRAAAGRGSPDVVFLTVIQTLRTWEVSIPGWEDDMIARMTRSRSKSDQMLMAHTLALFAGRGDGWSILAKELADEKSTYAASAITRVNSFDGLKDKDGKIIDVVSELEKAQTTAAPNIREKIDKKSIEIKTQRRSKQ